MRLAALRSEEAVPLPVTLGVPGPFRHRVHHGGSFYSETKVSEMLRGRSCLWDPFTLGSTMRREAAP